MKENLEEHFIACMVLHALGDTIGYKNGEWEFKIMSVQSNNLSTAVQEKLFEFFDLGGINHIPKEDWNVSDDTILHMKTAEALLENYNSINKLGNIAKEKYIEAFEQFKKDKETKNRAPGNITMANLKLLKEGKEWNEIPYNFNFGGSGASMRSLCIGLAYHDKKDREMLIQIAIETSRITHNSTTGYLGGIAAALFTAFAIEKNRY